MTGDRMILDAVQAAELLGIARRTLWRWTRGGLVLHRKLGRLITYRRDELLAWHNALEGPTLAQALEVPDRMWQLVNARRVKPKDTPDEPSVASEEVP